jgi:hypothetical protein
VTGQAAFPDSVAFLLLSWLGSMLFSSVTASTLISILPPQALILEKNLIAWNKIL